MTDRRPHDLGHLAIGAICGAITGAIVAGFLRPLFAVPSGGVGYITVHRYPKDWDIAVAALIVLGSFLGSLLAARRAPQPETRGNSRPRWVAAAAVVFVLSCALHYLPYAPLDLYHDGEHLTPAFLLRSGARPYADVYFNRGFATDGGLDLLVLGDPPSPVRVRLLWTILGAATLALLAPIAAEMCTTSAGVAAATFGSFCVAGGGVLKLFNYFRLAPVLIAILGLLRFLRTGRALPLAMAIAASAAGILWSLDTGMYALAGTIVLVVALQGTRVGRVGWRTLLTMLAASAFIPLLILLGTRADLRQFLIDSFVTIPRVAWVVWSLPQPDPPNFHDFLYWLADDSGRYYVPLAVYGLALAGAVRRWRSGDRTEAARMVVITTFALLLFRSAVGRADGNHIRFAAPLFGIAAVAWLLEPMAVRSRVIGTIVAGTFCLLVLDAVPNVMAVFDAVREWPASHRPDGLVPMPLPAAKGLYADPEFAADISLLNVYVSSLGPGAEILVASNHEALYYLLERKTPARCLEIMMWSAPPVFAEEMARLRARPPACVIVPGPKEIAIDGLSTRERVPQLMEWIDSNYPRRLQFGSFVVAAK